MEKTGKDKVKELEKKVDRLSRLMVAFKQSFADGKQENYELRFIIQDLQKQCEQFRDALYKTREENAKLKKELEIKNEGVEEATDVEITEPTP